MTKENVIIKLKIEESIIPAFSLVSSTLVVKQEENKQQRQAWKALNKQRLFNLVAAQGFTLIELLVVILIIGILAAVALPQYQKAVEKSRLSEAILNTNTLKKAIDMYLLQEGFPSATTDMLNGVLDIDMAHLSYNADASELLNAGGISTNFYCSESFCYQAECNDEHCALNANRYPGGEYAFYSYRGENGWVDGFYPCSTLGDKMYQTIKYLGYEEYFC